MKKLIFVLFLATAFSASYAKPLFEDDEQLSVKAKAKVELAKQKMYSGKTREALVMFKEILIESPKNGTVLYLAADCSYKLGEVDNAVKYLETGKTVVSVKPQNFYLLGLIYLNDDKVNEA